MKAEDQDAGLIFASTTKDRGLNDIRGFQSEVAGGNDARFPKFEDTILRPRGKPGTAIQFQRRELVAVLWAETKAAAPWGSAAAVELRGGETAVSLKG